MNQPIPQHSPRANDLQPPRCPNCAQLSVFIESSEEVYHGRDYGPLYICRPCKAWVGVHANTKIPKGILADAELRREKINLHSVFDQLWQKAEEMYEGGGRKVRDVARTRAYQWLAEQLGIPVEECHIGMFTVPMCRRAMAVFHAHQPTMWSIRKWAKAR